jgi:hypothetical protein
MNYPQIASGGQVSHGVPHDHPHYEAELSRTLAVVVSLERDPPGVLLITASFAVCLPQMRSAPC